MNGRRKASLLLAASLGLNAALGGILIYQAVRPRSDSIRYQRENDRRSGPPWAGERSRSSLPDSVRQLTRLSDEQTSRIRELRRAMEAEIQPVRDEIRALQRSLGSEMERPEPNRARLDSLMAEIGARQRILQSLSVDLMLREREVLLPEQFRYFLRWMVPGVVSPADVYGRDSRRRDSEHDTQPRGGGRGNAQGQRPTQTPPPPGSPPPPPPGGRAENPR